jgi:hypothetical protein
MPRERFNRAQPVGSAVNNGSQWLEALLGPNASPSVTLGERTQAAREPLLLHE